MLRPWAVLAVSIVLLLILARLARLRAAFRPLLLPFVCSVAALVLLTAAYEGRLPESPWILLAFLVPLLVLVVRVSVLVFQTLFRRSQRAAAPALLESLVAVLLYGLGAGVIVHRAFGIELTPFLATSAVVGAVVGLALQDTLGNLFAGISLHTEGPFRVGDWVRVGDRDGRVEQVSWRAVRLRSWDNDSVTIPNNEVSRHAVLNYSLPEAPHSRVLVIGVGYQTPPNKVVSVLQHLLEQIAAVCRDPRPGVRIVGFHESSIHYEVRYWFRAYEDYRQAEGEIHRLVWYHFRRHGIEIPYPTRTVYMHALEPAELKEAPHSRLERALRGIDLFRPLSEPELATAAAAFRHLHYAAGERIIEEGSPGDSFFVIDRGEVEVWKTLAGAPRALARLMEGQFFGEMALLTGERRAASVVAATDVDLFTIDKAGFESILVANPGITLDISTILAERRDALEQAWGDATPARPASSSGEQKQRILDRIRSYFGL